MDFWGRNQFPVFLSALSLSMPGPNSIRVLKKTLKLFLGLRLNPIRGLPITGGYHIYWEFLGPTQKNKQTKTSFEVEKIKAKVAFTARDFSFSEIRQLSKLSIARCWQSRSMKRKNLSKNKYKLKSFILKMKFFPPAMIHFFANLMT